MSDSTPATAANDVRPEGESPNNGAADVRTPATAATMASVTNPFLNRPADWGMEDVVWCYRRTLLRVEWSRAEEPHCEHSGPPLMPYYQPASKCRICKDRPKLIEWRDYWAKIKAEAARIRAEHDDAT